MLAILTFRSAEDCLTPDQVVERLRAEFDDVELDPAEGRSRAAKELALLRWLNAPSEIVDMAERGVEHARWVVVREGSATFGFVLTPEANIRIDHEEDLQPLIDRCAEVVNCHVERCG